MYLNEELINTYICISKASKLNNQYQGRKNFMISLILIFSTVPRETILSRNFKIAGRWEGGSCLGTHVRIKDFKIKKIKNLKKIK